MHLSKEKQQILGDIEKEFNMQQEEGKKYIISQDRFVKVLENILDLTSGRNVHEIMYEELMHRSIFGSNRNSLKLEETV